jgi:hypothetical protein
MSKECIFVHVRAFGLLVIAVSIAILVLRVFLYIPRYQQFSYH